MYYVYVLKSQKNGDIYIGYSDDLRRRFNEHNQGKAKFTKSYIPWILVYYEAYKNKKDATMREKELKSHKPKEFFKEHLQNSLII